MARIRTIKPEALQHRKIGPLPDRAFRLWIGMLTQADDEGRLIADPEQLRVLVFGYQPKVTRALTEDSLRTLADCGLIRLYLNGDRQLADFPSWAEHQKVNRPTRSKLPSYDDSVSIHGVLTEDSLGIKDQGSRIKDQGSRIKDQGGEYEGGVRPLTERSSPDGFDTFWSAYPVKEGRGKAEAAWRKYAKAVPLEAILAGVARWQASQRWADGYVVPPVRWLTEKRWTDEPAPRKLSPAERLHEEAVAQWKEGKG